MRPGEFLGIVADRPSDAEALVRLLAMPDGYRGEVLLGGVPLRDLDRDECRRMLLVEPHHADLFTGTVGANLIRTEDPGPALRAAAADVPLDREVAERGAGLSGGQRQRLALARALLARPPILVLHDPTTAVDAVTEHAIAQGVKELRAGLTTVVLTSSPALLAAADRVVVLAGGTVTADGDHAGLGAADATYRRTVLR